MGNQKIPMRKCVGCNEMKSKKELIRVVSSEDNGLFIDKTAKANGRGAYLCNQLSCLEKAMKSKGLERSFKCKISDELYQALREDLNNE